MQRAHVREAVRDPLGSDVDAAVNGDQQVRRRVHDARREEHIAGRRDDSHDVHLPCQPVHHTEPAYTVFWNLAIDQMDVYRCSHFLVLCAWCVPDRLAGACKGLAYASRVLVRLPQ